jgi:hypothetical protein
MSDRPVRKIGIRDFISHVEKCSQELSTYLKREFLTSLADFRDLSRPHRRSSPYPSFAALKAAQERTEEAAEQSLLLCDYLIDNLEIICERARQDVNQLRPSSGFARNPKSKME